MGGAAAGKDDACRRGASSAERKDNRHSRRRLDETRTKSSAKAWVGKRASPLCLWGHRREPEAGPNVVVDDGRGVLGVPVGLRNATDRGEELGQRHRRAEAAQIGVE